MTGAPAFGQDPTGTHHVEQADVQWCEPGRRCPEVGRPKLMLQYGGGLCGTIWEGTPDGRPGWVQYLVRRRL